MRRTTGFLTLIAGLLFASTALAQDLAPLGNLVACRAEPAEKVNLSFSYDGGACQETDTAKVALVEGNMATASVPTHNNAEVCTMQVVQIDYAGTLDVPAEITALTVQVLNPDSEVQAGGKTDILPKCAQ
jgi:hypothetical protein